MEPGPVDIIGRHLGSRYLVEELLGRGGMADVYRGRDQRLGRSVALKVLRAELRSDGALRRRFETEARSAARLTHPNVVTVYDVGEDGDLAYLVMELLSGETLADRIRRGPLSEAEARRVGLDILAGLAAAHAVGILHRDVKPANVLFAADGSATLADFGIAKALEVHDHPDDLTRTSLILGTSAYLAPERAEGAAGSPGSDLWAVGVVLYEALSGVKPFAGPSALATLLAAKEGRTAAVDTLHPGLSPAMVTVVEKALQPLPEERYRSATEMSSALRSLPAVDPTQASSSTTPGLLGAGLAGADSTVPMAVAAPTAIWERPAEPVPERSTPTALLGIGLAALVTLLIVVIVALLLWPSGAKQLPHRTRLPAVAESSTSTPPSTTSTTTTTTTAPTTTTTAPQPTQPTAPAPPTTAAPPTQPTAPAPPTTAAPPTQPTKPPGP